VERIVIGVNGQLIVPAGGQESPSLEAGGQVVCAVAEPVVRASAVRSSAMLVRLRCSSFGVRDLGSATLHFREFDEATLVQVDELAPLGVGGIHLAVQPG
jgi:hypothetical protein